MEHLIFILIAFALLVGFFILTQYEVKHDMRFFGVGRARLDTNVERIEYILAHVDFGAFVREEVRHAMDRIRHAAAHLSLQAVRAIERALTRVVRYFRARHEERAVPRESTREFVKTLSDFKDGLKATHPDIEVK